MAMARSLPHLFFFLLLVSTAPAARDLPGDATTGKNLDEACDETQFPDLCARSLAAFPESRTASPRRLAELSVLAALDAGRAAATSAHDALNDVQDDDDGLLTRCLDGCSADVEEAVARLSALSREPTDARFLDVKAWLSANLDGPAAYEAACRYAPAGEARDAAVARSVEFDMMLRVALDLITEASGSMSATDAMMQARAPAYGAPYGSPAYGAGAPSYGAPSYGGARRPRAPAPAPPSKGYGRRRPSAPAPSPLGGYGAGMPRMRAPAPAPAKGYGHRRPRPRPRVPAPSRKPRAPAPSPSYGAARRPRAPAPSPSYGAARRPRAPAPSPFGRYGAPAGAPSYGGARRPRPRAPAPSPSYGGARWPRPRAPAPSPSYGGARRPRAPAPLPFGGYGTPAGAPAYGARRPGATRPPPSTGATRPPPPSTYFSIVDTDETA